MDLSFNLTHNWTLCGMQDLSAATPSVPGLGLGLRTESFVTSWIHAGQVVLDSDSTCDSLVLHRVLTPELVSFTGSNVANAPVHARSAHLSVSPVGRHGDSSGVGLPLRAAADHPGQDAGAAPPLHPERAAECESSLVQFTAGRPVNSRTKCDSSRSKSWSDAKRWK